MKRVIVVLTTLVLLAASGEAASPKFVKLNLLGPEGLVGVSFDSRFKEGSKFGYNVGLGYGFMNLTQIYELGGTLVPTNTTRLSLVDPVIDRAGMYNTYSAPLNVYYLVGKRNHFFKASLGVNLFLADYNYSEKECKVGYFTYAKLGYRYEAKKTPLMVEGGLTVPFYTPGSGLSYAASLTPFVSLGYRL